MLLCAQYVIPITSDIIKEMRVGMLLNCAVNPGRFIDAESMPRIGTIDAARYHMRHRNP